MNVIVIGAGPVHGLDAGACTVLGDAAATHFDSATERWTVTTADGRCATAAVVVDARPSADPTMAAHGVPNYFRIPGPGVRRQARYVARCLRLIQRSGATRIEAKGRIVVRPWPLPRVAGRLDLSGANPGPDELYDGPATVTVSGRDVAARVRLTGHLNAIDGQYHWQGTVFEALPDTSRHRSAAMTLTIAGRTVAARVVEQTPWGTHMIAGVGDPPFAH